MLVTTGNINVVEITGNTEIIKLDSNEAKVPTYANLPKALYGATGGFVGGKMVICGGSNDLDSNEYEVISRECYTLDQENATFLGNMKRKRMLTSSIVMGNNLWILGGSGGPVSGRTSEYIAVNGSRKDGPNLPAGPGGGFESHAALKINETTAMLIGGYNNEIYSQTWYYTQDQTEWIPGPPLNQARCMHTAGLIYDSITLEEYFVVIGGLNDGKLNSTEILSKDGSEWIKGKLFKILIRISILKI